jgi:hypothetical protein
MQSYKILTPVRGCQCQQSLRETTGGEESEQLSIERSMWISKAPQKSENVHCSSMADESTCLRASIAQKLKHRCSQAALHGLTRLIDTMGSVLLCITYSLSALWPNVRLQLLKIQECEYLNTAFGPRSRQVLVQVGSHTISRGWDLQGVSPTGVGSPQQLPGEGHRCHRGLQHQGHHYRHNTRAGQNYPGW